LLVFYGHVLQSLSIAGWLSVRPPFHFIYAFHMPLFFLVAGFFFQPGHALGERAGALVRRRLLPVAFFGLLMLPFWSYGPLRHGANWWAVVWPQMAGYVRGMPQLNWGTWFLVCLFMCECMALVLLRRVKSMAGQILLGLLCIGVGTQFCAHVHGVAELTGIEDPTWFIYEAVVALGFYAIGHAVFPWLQRLARPDVVVGIIAVLSLLLALDTLGLNASSPDLVVMMASSQHGNALDFTITALAGSFLILGLGMLLARVRLLRVIGQKSLILLGLNGVFFHFVNPLLTKVLGPQDTLVSVCGYALLLTVVSLLLYWPLVRLLEHYVPQLVGKPAARGPWLPAMESLPQRSAASA
jgi:fucose 4-O-acetylase-like acetyltransferase